MSNNICSLVWTMTIKFFFSQVCSTTGVIADNLARGKASHSGSICMPPGITKSGYSFWAVDGDTNQDCVNSNKCTCTAAVAETQDLAWLAVDLGDYFTITHVTIFNRKDIYSDLNGLHVDVYHVNPILCNSSYTRCSAFWQEPSDDVITLTCASNTWGRYVYAWRDATWTISEIEVYGEKLLSAPVSCALTSWKKLKNILSPNDRLLGYVQSPIQCIHLCHRTYTYCDKIVYVQTESNTRNRCYVSWYNQFSRILYNITGLTSNEIYYTYMPCEPYESIYILLSK